MERYPRDNIIFTNDSEVIGENIELVKNGVLYSNEGIDNLNFVPYDKITVIKYERMTDVTEETKSEKPTRTSTVEDDEPQGREYRRGDH